jgi:DNA-binding GntR family transcriptional regulator
MTKANPKTTGARKAPKRGTTINLPGRGYRADELYQDLRGKILSGAFAPKERLVEEVIARQASVSRTPVREALHRLETEGLVKSTEQGVIVIDFSATELADLCSAREGLEGFVARLAATAVSEMEVEILQRVIESTRDAVERADVDEQVQLNHRFHETIWRGARNGYLEHQLETLRTVIERHGDTTLRNPQRQRETLEEHTAILDAIKAHDPEAADAAARLHFRRAMSLRLIAQSERAQG